MSNPLRPESNNLFQARLVLVLALAVVSLAAGLEAAAVDLKPVAYLPLISLVRPAPLPYPNCRYGSVALWNPVDEYDVAPLNLGWYLTAATQTPPLVDGVLPVQMIRLKGRDCPWPDCPTPEYWSEAIITPSLEDGSLGLMIDENPGAIWLVGNEPDRRYVMDDVLPSQYARAYHDIYTYIKQRDPAARIAIGSVVVPTPLRLQYLDMILTEYSARYGRSMPVDIWTSHVHMVQEVRDSWGADVPPGTDEDTGVVFTKSQHADVDTFTQLVIDLRAWMNAHGQRDKPLYITEFGILWPDWLVDEFGDPFDEARVIDYMQQTMAWLDAYRDAQLGFAGDADRLVQRWNWYSLDDDSVANPELPDHHRWNGWLFESESRERSVFGDAFDDFTERIWPSVDLVPQHLRTSPASPPVVRPEDSITLTLQVDVYNAGNSQLDRPFMVAFYEQQEGVEELIATVTVTRPISGCAGHVTAQVVWTDTSPGAHRVLISVDSDDAASESIESNNDLIGMVLVPYHRLYFPLAHSE